MTSEDTASSSGWGFLGWLLGALLVVALCAFAFWWLRLREGESFTVEKIEPYRMEEKPPEAAREPAIKEAPPPPVRPQTPAGVVTASRPAPAANPGGFVTSTINTRRPVQYAAATANPPQQTAQTQTEAQAPRRGVAADGRIVTSLSSMRKRLD
ncbi:hypothetical protein [Aurantiacibacter rhizosphaerae]|uniref:Uncharacterized protein n=1 Tax=Aurantiacibacter rhizosphaerae TaxID=2691582 RepID=A0A844XIP6_9SPHN|nr:hypothetical protein [Aurantiacibacter rhizosphaerae]MWV29418.1 hypothetical protein [Aurantiacibacter rhizosphaerae]